MLPYVLPMPRLVKVRTKAEALSIAYEPLVNRSLDLKSPIGVLRINRLTTYIQVQRSAGKVRTVHRKARASRVRRLSPQLVLIFAGAKC